MKICWDNLENLKYDSKKELWRDIRYPKAGIYYKYCDRCEICEEPFLNIKAVLGRFCSRMCFYKSNVSKINLKRISSFNRHDWMRGKTHSEESKKKISKGVKEAFSDKSRLYQWKGGVTKANIPLYDTYAPQIEFAELVRRDPNNYDYLQVRCTYCGKWFRPKTDSVMRRITALNGFPEKYKRFATENRLYCSKECKIECPIYRTFRYSAEESSSKNFSREVQPELRQLVFERDKYECQKCGQDKNLQCHHFEGIKYNPLESADMDACITLCKKCHREAHRDRGCRYSDLKCE